MPLEWIFGLALRRPSSPPIQSIYVDFYVIDKLWPDYSIGQFHEVLAWYQDRDSESSFDMLDKTHHSSSNENLLFINRF